MGDLVGWSDASGCVHRTSATRAVDTPRATTTGLCTGRVEHGTSAEGRSRARLHRVRVLTEVRIHDSEYAPADRPVSGALMTVEVRVLPCDVVVTVHEGESI